MPVRGLAYVSYPTADEVVPALLDDHSGFVRKGSWGAEVAFLVRSAPFSHFVGPRTSPKVLSRTAGPFEESQTPFGSVGWLAARDLLMIRVEAAPGRSRAAYLWKGGGLERLF